MRKIVLLVLIIASIVYWKTEIIELVQKNQYYQQLNPNLIHSIKDAEGDWSPIDFSKLLQKVEIQDENKINAKDFNDIQSQKDVPQEIDVPELVVNHADELLFDTKMVNLLQENVDLLSVWDKLSVISIALNNFTMEEMNAWKEMLSDGISEGEKKDFNQLIIDRLSERDLSKLTALTKKYMSKLPENELAE